jgi:hypothetical protein
MFGMLISTALWSVEAYNQKVKPKFRQEISFNMDKMIKKNYREIKLLQIMY